MTHPAANFVAFQVCWLVNVVAAARGLPWLGPVSSAAWLALHVLAVRSERALELRLITTAVAIGSVADSALVLAGLLAFEEPARVGPLTTPWMVALWAGFAAMLRHALGWLRGRYLLGAVLGAAGGPLAYAGGEALGAVSLAGVPALVAIGAEYAIATPLLLALLARDERRERAGGIARAVPEEPGR